MRGLSLDSIRLQNALQSAVGDRRPLTARAGVPVFRRFAEHLATLDRLA